MSDDSAAVTVDVFQPSPARIQRGPAEHYPWLFTFTGEDVLELTSWNAAASVQLALNGRVHVEPGQVIPFAAVHTPNTDRSRRSTVHTVPRGELLNVVVFATAGAPRIGETFVRLAVLRGGGPASTRLGTLLQGHVTTEQTQGWPGTPIADSFAGHGVLRLVVGTQPAVNGEILETVPTGARWELLTFSTTLTEVGGANTIPKLVIDDGAGHEIASIDGANGVLSATFTYAWLAALGYTSATINGFRTQIGAPAGLTLLAGHRIRTVTTLIGGGDQYTAPVYTVREHLEAN